MDAEGSSSALARLRARLSGRIVLLSLAAALALAGAALAVVPLGLQNPGFEQDLDFWSAKTVREDVYGNNRTVVYDPAPCRVPDGVCVLRRDTFSVREEVYNPHSGKTRTRVRKVKVKPKSGHQMVRLGGPFTDPGQRQAIERYEVSQTFRVDPARPVLRLAFNVFTFDYQGFDSLTFRVRITDDEGAVIAEFEQGSFGRPGDDSLKSTGWRPVDIDLTDYKNQQVHLQIASGGTQDRILGFWSYVDADKVRGR